MTDNDPSQPLTDSELETIRDLIGMHLQYGPALSIEGEAKLLAEVDRLRAENTAVRAQRDQFQKMMNSTVSAGVTIDGERLDALRERDALQEQLDAARELHEPARSSAWNYIYCVSGCGAGPLQGPDPFPCNTAKALGMALDQSGEGQANA
jgi:hypothetical protein